MKTIIQHDRGELSQFLVTKLRRRSYLKIFFSLATFAYLIFIGFIFNVGAIFEGARVERGLLLFSDMVAYKTHVILNLRRNELKVAVEGERLATYSPENYPKWFKGDAEKFEVKLREGYRVRYENGSLHYFIPEYGLIKVKKKKSKIIATFPENAPSLPVGFKISEFKFDARPVFKHRVQFSKSKIEIHYFNFGWENFWFPMGSPFNGMGFLEILDLIFLQERLVAKTSNVTAVLKEFWNHPTWQHGELAIAVLETILMAFLGTLTATLVGLPLAFVAAENLNPFGILRFGIRRVFDFLRGIDYLIWSLIFIRSFGLGPLTGALAIAFTDTGTLGKLFTEALENTDSKQKEGVQATGASSIKQFRFGVIPQILPVLASQILYYFESNMRSATVIGALGAGGIGLMLVQTMRTRRDWENSLYIIVVTILIVIIADVISSLLRKKLISG